MLTGLDENGNLEPSFGSFGFRTLGQQRRTGGGGGPLGQDPHPRPAARQPLLQERDAEEQEDGQKGTGQGADRHRSPERPPAAAERRLDPSFGRTGSVNFVDPKVGSFSALTVDGKERIYLAGRIGAASPNSRTTRSTATQFLLERTQANGRIDGTFGHEGAVDRRLRRPRRRFATQVELVAKGRILVGGGIESPELASGGGFALARFLPGRS